MSDVVEFLPRAISDVFSGHAALRPPNRRRVSLSAQDSLYIKQPGAPGTPWSPEETPYMVAPMDMLASRKHEAVAFVGPARTGKTAGLLLGWMAHAVVNDPGDMLFVQMTKEKAREFSKTDVDRAIEHSPDIAGMRSKKVTDSNTFDTMFRHGMWLRLAWPTVSNVSGSTYRYVGITDYDRIENKENVDGEGPLFDLARKRTTTFMSRGMCLVESSPGEELADPNWRAATPHEAPPVRGVLGIYNLSDRRRWYWKCPHCREDFEPAPGLGLFNLPSEDELLSEIREIDVDKMADDYGKRIVCPHCQCMIFAGEKMVLNAAGRWLTEAEIMGRVASAQIAGFWMGGIAAAYQNWRSLVLRHLLGLRDYALTGSEETLKVTTNTDQGMPYMSMHIREAAASARAPEDRTTDDVQRFIVPEWARMVIAMVDVQGGTRPRFVVQVHAVGPHYEQQLVNRFTIFDSRRPGMVEGEYAPLDPARYPEDWDRITEEVVRSTYRTPIEGKEIKVLRTVIDTGGEDGVTPHALTYYRRMRRAGMAKRIVLYKGTGKPGAAEIRETLQGLSKDVPVFLCNSNKLADRVMSGLKREKRGPGYYHFPKPKGPKNPDGWLPQAFFDELKAEVRNADGTYTQLRSRNESFDLCKMAYTCMLSLHMDRKGFWDNPPDWAMPLAENRELVTAQDRRAMKADLPVEQVPEPVARPVRQGPRERRVVSSPYLK